jgi:tripartite-type tricarboxylate transporter receptor subunit TctC
MTVVKTIGLLASAMIAAGSIASDACGEAAQDFYRNKQVRLIVGHPVGNDHDVGGRLLQDISASTFRAGPASSFRT